MIFALLLPIVMMFGRSDSLQQHGMDWRPPRPHLWEPNFSPSHLEPADDVVCLPRRDWADIYSSCKNDAVEILKSMTVNNRNKNVGDYSISGRSKMNGAGPMMDRSFGFKFLGINALANHLINSVTLTTTSTTFSTTYSTLTIGTVVTCIPTGRFRVGSSTPCRRKRESDEVREILNGIEPSKVQRIEPSFSDVDIMLLGKGNSFFDDIQRILLESSMRQDETTSFGENQDYIVAPRKLGYGHEFLENLPGETFFVSTSTITSFSFYTRTSTRRIVGQFAGAGDLSCLPDCFVICT